MDEISESAMLLCYKHHDTENQREKNYSLKEKIIIAYAKLIVLETHENGYVEPYLIKLMQTKQSVVLICAKIQAEEADFDEITEHALQRRLAAEQSYYAADSERNQEIYTLNFELNNINNELRYYEQRAANRKAAINAAKEQAETQNFELDRRHNLPTLYDKKGR
ncbi:MAG: hypothetical protein EZS28_012788 [Streblomastix strix]|uniref:Uncharacterized protein n=1 Tax=Streblomastix strix TaxID=222440 RepID=A0A5J4W9T3_9EUKA|nr:MAG: hypothetical protein EZS28_012788 [Streblomastix strix]